MTLELHETTSAVSPSTSQAACRMPGQRLPVNVGSNERLVGAAAGAGLVLLGLAQARRCTVLSLLIGGGLLFRGLTGHCSLYQQLGVSTVGSDEQ